MVKFSLKTILTALVAAVMLSSCASSTLITSVPPGAKVTINGMLKGVTPYKMTDTKIIGATSTIRLELNGYQPKDVMIQKNEQVDVGAVIGGLFFWFPFLWTMGYEPMHMYELTPESGK
jgi:hypothetical protein